MYYNMYAYLEVDISVREDGSKRVQVWEYTHTWTETIKMQMQDKQSHKFYYRIVNDAHGFYYNESGFITTNKKTKKHTWGSVLNGIFHIP